MIFIFTAKKNETMQQKLRKKWLELSKRPKFFKENNRKAKSSEEMATSGKILVEVCYEETQCCFFERKDYNTAVLIRLISLSLWKDSRRKGANQVLLILAVSYPWPYFYSSASVVTARNASKFWTYSVPVGTSMLEHFIRAAFQLLYRVVLYPRS